MENKKHKFEEKRDEFESKLVDLARVVRVVAGGRRFRFRAVVVVGDKKGKVGVGVSKGKDVSIAVEKATRQAKKSIINVIMENGTIPFEVEAKYKAAVVLLKPAQSGKGVVAGGAMRIICELCGLRDVVGKIKGRTTNKLSNAKATMKALEQLRQRMPKKKKEDEGEEKKEIKNEHTEEKNKGKLIESKKGLVKKIIKKETGNKI